MNSHGIVTFLYSVRAEQDKNSLLLSHVSVFYIAIRNFLNQSLTFSIDSFSLSFSSDSVPFIYIYIYQKMNVSNFQMLLRHFVTLKLSLKDE